MTASMLRELAFVVWTDAAHIHDPNAPRAEHDVDVRGDEDRLFDIAEEIDRRAIAAESGPLFELLAGESLL